MLFSPLTLRGVWKHARMFFKPARAPGEPERDHPVAPRTRGGEEVPMSTGKLLWLLAVAAGASVASLYYCQPLLALLAADFSTTERGAGLVPTLTQAGYAAGMLLVVPLGDTAERRRLIVLAALCSAAALLAVAAAPSLAFLCAASFALGLVSVVPQLAVPFAAGIVPAAERGRSVGKVMSGLLVGILLSRTVSGLVGAHLGWRAIYLIAAAVTLLLALALRIFLPRQEPALRLSYPRLLASLPGLLREPLLRRHAILGALALAAFSAFWTTLTFLLEAPPFRLGSDAAGAFGVVGVAGALAAPFAGRLADRIGTRAVNGLALLLVLVSYCVFAAASTSLVLLGVGVVLLDLGVQANHISNQTRILGLSADARNRLNSVYMAIYFTGAAAGSALSSHAYASWRWAGVSALGIGLSLLGLAAFFTLDSGAAKEADAAATRSREAETFPHSRPAGDTLH